MSVDCTLQLLWVPDRSALRQSFTALRASATEAGLLHVPSASQSLQRFATTAAQTVWAALCLMAGLFRRHGADYCAAS